MYGLILVEIRMGEEMRESIKFIMSIVVRIFFILIILRKKRREG